MRIMRTNIQLFLLHDSTTLYTKNNMIDHYLFHYLFSFRKNVGNSFNSKNFVVKTFILFSNFDSKMSIENGQDHKLCVSPIRQLKIYFEMCLVNLFISIDASHCEDIACIGINSFYLIILFDHLFYSTTILWLSYFLKVISK